jgi:radical SAM superfamily enzyme YgiQ (UPF0313 family)
MFKKTVLLYHPQLEKSGNTKARGIPLSLLLIAGPLVEKGYKVKIFDKPIDKNAQEKVLENLDDVICVGFTVLTGHPIADSLELSKKIKSINPNIPIVWGGWHPSILAEQTVENDNVDIVVKGQGETTFLELVQHLEKKKSLKKVLGITYKSNNKIIVNPDRPRTPLDNLPPVPYHIVNLQKYITDIAGIGKRTLNYISSQGCPYCCAFCADALIYKRKRMDLSAERVIKDLKKLIEEYNIDSIIFDDTNFFVDKEKVKRICLGIIKNKWKIKWGAYERTSHFLTFDKETIRLIKDSGCCLLIAGAESGSQRILDFLDKRIKVEDTISFSKLCSEYGIGVVYDFMFGFPNEKIDDFKETINLIRDVYKINKNNGLCILFYTPYPGTPLYDKVIKKYGFKPPMSLEEWSEYDPSTIETKWIDEEYKEKLNAFLFYLQFAFLNEQFKEKLNNFKKFKFLIWPMHKIALLRFKLNLFKFPIEKKIYNVLKKYFK